MTINRDEAYEMLARAFGNAWTELDADRQRVILRDFIEAVEDEDLSASEYRSRIGAANLRSYGDVMLVRERHGWDR